MCIVILQKGKVVNVVNKVKQFRDFGKYFRLLIIQVQVILNSIKTFNEQHFREQQIEIFCS